MSVAFGCLSLMSLRNPFAELVGLVLGKSDLHSILCLLVFFIVSTVVAYLTNPSENSFRAYLTEQSFRHHLSRLDENLDDENVVHAPRFSHFSSGYPARNMTGRAGESTHSGFHFANRASISLRTPKHVFHSFAIFTIAAMVPVAKSSSRTDDGDSWSISDSWYIGAFGKWWRGGVWETWYQDVIARTKDEESWNSGILSIKNLDMFPEFHGPSFNAKTIQFSSIKPSPPKLRNRDRVLPKASSLRSSSPPPLSKTASLPLHAKRVPVPSNEKLNDQVSPTLSCPPLHSIVADGIGRLGSAPSSRSGLFEQSPLIAEILRQISVSSTSVQELRNQLSECQASASQSHDTLQLELDVCRDRKRQEDASKSDLKARTKMLDDSKRTSESIKRDADRKLKAAHSTRDTAQRRVELLDKEIVTLTSRLQEDRSFLAEKSSDTSPLDLEMTQVVEMKKQEIKAAEDLLASLNRRSRELEERLASERERLQSLKDKSELRRQELSSEVGVQDGYLPTDSPYSMIFEGVPHSAHHQQYVQGIELFGHNGIDAPQDHYTLQEFYSNNHLASPVHVNGISPYNGSSNCDSFNSSPEEMEHPVFDHPAYSRSTEFLTSISDERVYQNYPLEDSPTRSMVPTCIVTQSHINHLANGLDYTPYEGPAAVKHPSWSLNAGKDQIAYLQDGYKMGQDLTFVQQPQKRLNPDAKAFRLGRRTSPPGLGPDTPYDALNPNGLGMGSLQPATTANQSFLRAFAPSPAERERLQQLQRALGGSTNSSLERLPSLSDVGSIPSSPSRIHSSPALPGPASTTTSTKGLQLPSWFPTFQPRKSKFKPWDDETEEAGETEP